MKSALIILFPDFEEIEAVSTIDVLRRGKIDVVVASLAGGKSVVGTHKITCNADIEGIPEKDFDGLIIPGGPGVLLLRNNKNLLNFILEKYNQKKLIGAICAAPILLYDTGILQKHRYTCHFSMVKELKDARIHEPVVCDENVITACGPAAGINFGLAIVEFFKNITSVQEIAHEMMCNF